jgi:hypothetical protein
MNDPLILGGTVYAALAFLYGLASPFMSDKGYSPFVSTAMGMFYGSVLSIPGCVVGVLMGAWLRFLMEGV